MLGFRYGDQRDPERKEKRLAAEAVYPLPEKLFRCVVCNEPDRANIKRAGRAFETYRKKIEDFRTKGRLRCFFCGVGEVGAGRLELDARRPGRAVAARRCMECANRACRDCMYAKFINAKDDRAFVLLHHIYCLKLGEPILHKSKHGKAAKKDETAKH